MKYIYSFLFVWMIGLSAWAQSGNDYNPENPADPEVPPTPPVYYTLTMDAAPSYGGSVNNSQLNVEANHEVYCRAYEKTGYRFKQWMVGDSLVSTDESFYFKMPAEDVVLIAYFDYVGYDPENPADPEAPGDDPVAEKSYNVTVYATPSVGGYFNSSSFWLKEGEEANVYAYPQNGYRFVSWKQNGVIISTANPLRVVMDTLNLEYTATFVYDPVSPDNPGSNNFNPATGEVVIDKFTVGNLNSVMSATVGGSENYSLVQSIMIVGQMNSSDFGFSYRLSNCSLIDLSRTTGYTEIPNWGFERMGSLTKILLPSTVERIGYGAFSGCANLSELVCYAAAPPVVSSNVFDASLTDLIVRVPSSALSLYKGAEIWKNFTILPLDEETYQLNVSLPADAADGRYKNMTLELNNISSGQVLRYIITDRTTYAFTNLISGTKYNVLVKNASNAVLGTIFDIKIEDEDVNVAFESLLQPQNIIAKVVTPDNEDVTSQVIVKWFDEEGKYLNQGTELKGHLEGSKVCYRVTLSNELALQYIAPQEAEYTVKSADNTIVMPLVPFEETTLTGVVKDVTTGSGIYNATVTISQTLNGKHSKSIVAKTDIAGAFSAIVYNAACDVMVAAYDYVSQTLHFDDLSNVEALNGIQLQEITGVRISTAFTYMGSIAEGESSNVEDGYDDQANISYTIYNKTAQKAITEFNVQSPYIVLLEEVNEGDVLSITAASRTKAFKDVTADGVVDANNRVKVTFPIVELGKLQATYMQSVSSKVVGVLYNDKGKLLDKSLYRDSTLIWADLEDGTYTLVTMESSDFFNSILNFAELTNVGLVEDIHYVKHDVVVQSGKITTLSIENVPVFDDSQFYYTGSNTHFTVNKQTVTVGNYVTLRAQVDFKSKYADKVSDVRLVVDLPGSCEFVDNSVMVGDGTSSYSIGENRIEVELKDVNDVVRFCVIPTNGGYCNPNAFVQFAIDGRKILQPIGTASFEAELMKISVPEITASTSVVISGLATSNSLIKIYDNDFLVGQTQSLANGQWSAKIELLKPYSWSFHSIYAEIWSTAGETFVSEIKDIMYDKNSVELRKIWMLYNGERILFDVKNRENSKNSYTYLGHSGVVDYTFIAEFSNCDTTNIKDVEFLVLLTDGSVRRINGIYSSLGKWVASSEFPDDGKVPINVIVDYVENQESPDNTEMFAEQAQILADCANEIFNYTQEHWNYSIVEDTEERIILDIVDNNDEHYTIKVRNIDFYEACNLMSEVQFEFSIDDMGYYLCNNTVILEDQIVVTFVDLGDSLAYEFSFIFDDSSRLLTRSLTGGFLSGLSWGGSKLGDVLSAAIPYLMIRSDLDNMYGLCKKYNWDLFESRNKTEDFLAVRCSDGSLRLSQGEIAQFRKELYFLKENEEGFIDNMYEYISEYKRKIEYCIAYDVVLTALGGKAAGMLAKCLNFMPNTKFVASVSKYFTKGTTSSEISKTLTNTLELGLGAIIGAANNVFNPAFADFHGTYEKFIVWAPKQFNYYMDKHISLQGDIKLNYKECEEDEEEDEEDGDNGNFPNPPLSPIVDPSGYVYEGVSSNRVEGVNASCYYKETVEDMYGDLHENVVLWDAEQYAQENPLFTDENGMYRWDVPQGMWQVKFEKEGYETTYSDWLPVPPPQLEVNIAMTQNKQPEVKTVHAYKDGIVVEFDKYMQPATLNTSNIFVVQNGEKVDGTVVMLNEEIAYRDSSVVYASKVRFVFDQPITAEEITLTISNRVKSYAGIQMQDTYTQTFDIEKEIKAIVADSLVSVFYGGEHTLAVKVTPTEAAAGKTLVVTSSSPMILAVANDSITLDSNGEAMVTVSGELPGSGAINYSIAGYDYTATTIVKVEYDNTEMTTNPTASIPSGTTVTKGTEVTLSCATEGAVIYYTLDGSCPCDEATQIRYDGTPIIINSNTELRMMAVAEGRYESDVVVYYYYVEGDVQMTANPTASIASGTTVAKGTEVTLNCATEGAVIYYTLDGSSPDDAATQIRYDGTPIVINETTTLRMMAVAEGYEKSYVVEYHYYVEEEVKPMEVTIHQKWDDVLICDNSSNEFVAYQWYKNDMPIAGETGQYYSEVGGLNGSYYVMAQNAAGDWGMSNVIVCAGRAEIGLKVTPSIVKKNEKCVVSIHRPEGNEEVVYLNVYNAMGQMVRRLEMTGSSVELEFGNSGPYFVKAVGLKDNVESEKVIVIE